MKYFFGALCASEVKDPRTFLPGRQLLSGWDADAWVPALTQFFS